MNKKFWRHKNVFITGSTGLLGSWVIKYLQNTDANIISLIRGSSFFSQNNQSIGITTVNGKVEDFECIKKILSEYKIDTVLHFAAQTIAPVANKSPLSTFETNIKGTWTVLEACRQSALVKRIIIASSYKAYGDSEKLPYTENTPLNGKHPYDVSKSCADLLAQAYYASYKLPLCITRCGNLFGGGDLNFNRIFPSVIRSAMLDEQPILRSDGSFVRDFFYVEDSVRGILRLVEVMNKKSITGEVFNFSNEKPIAVLDMVNIILKKMKSKYSPKILNNSTNEIHKQYLSAKKAHEILGWKPSFTMNQGINKTIAWYRNYFDKRKNFDTNVSRFLTSMEE